jgi:hypothetical protein
LCGHVRMFVEGVLTALMVARHGPACVCRRLATQLPPPSTTSSQAVGALALCLVCAGLLASTTSRPATPTSASARNATRSAQGATRKPSPSTTKPSSPKPATTTKPATARNVTAASRGMSWLSWVHGVPGCHIARSQPLLFTTCHLPKQLPPCLYCSLM